MAAENYNPTFQEDIEYSKTLNLAKQSYKNKKFGDCLISVNTLLAMQPGQKQLEKAKQSLEHSLDKKKAARTTKTIVGAIEILANILSPAHVPGISEAKIKFDYLVLYYDSLAVQPLEANKLGAAFKRLTG